MTRPGPEEFKARWCLRGYLDPDVMELAGSGATQSPTVSQLGSNALVSNDCCNGWDLQLGGIRGAFLEADALNRKKDRCTQVFLQEESQGCLMDQ